MLYVRKVHEVHARSHPVDHVSVNPFRGKTIGEKIENFYIKEVAPNSQSNQLSHSESLETG